MAGVPGSYTQGASDEPQFERNSWSDGGSVNDTDAARTVSILLAHHPYGPRPHLAGTSGHVACDPY